MGKKCKKKNCCGNKCVVTETYSSYPYGYGYPYGGCYPPACGVPRPACGVPPACGVVPACGGGCYPGCAPRPAVVYEPRPVIYEPYRPACGALEPYRACGLY